MWFYDLAEKQDFMFFFVVKHDFTVLKGKHDFTALVKQYDFPILSENMINGLSWKTWFYSFDGKIILQFW